MWIWIIIIACIIGALIGAANGENKSEDAVTGAMAGGCIAAGCLWRIALTAIGILLVLWIFCALFG